MRSREKIRQDDVSVALKKFLSKGGIIHRLPDQNYRDSHPIGEDKYQIYESLANLSSLSNNKPWEKNP